MQEVVRLCQGGRDESKILSLPVEGIRLELRSTLVHNQPDELEKPTSFDFIWVSVNQVYGM